MSRLTFCNLVDKMQGSVSYKINGDKSIKEFTVGCYNVAVQALTFDVARVYFFDGVDATKEIPIPPNVIMNAISEDGNETIVSPHRQEFVIVWHRAYKMVINGKLALRIDNQKQQSINVLLKPPGE